MTDGKAPATPASGERAQRTSEPLLPSVSTGAPQVPMGCPFCGMLGRVRTITRTGEATVYCESGELHTASTGYWANPAEAIAAWNRRAAPSPAGEVGEKFAKIADEHASMFKVKAGEVSSAYRNGGYDAAIDLARAIRALASSSEPLSAGEGESGGIQGPASDVVQNKEVSK